MTDAELATLKPGDTVLVPSPGTFPPVTCVVTRVDRRTVYLREEGGGLATSRPASELVLAPPDVLLTPDAALRSLESLARARSVWCARVMVDAVTQEQIEREINYRFPRDHHTREYEHRQALEETATDIVALFAPLQAKVEEQAATIAELTREQGEARGQVLDQDGALASIADCVNMALREFGRSTQTLAARFWPKVVKTVTCWIWIGSRKALRARVAGEQSVIKAVDAFATARSLALRDRFNGPAVDAQNEAVQKLLLAHRALAALAARPEAT